MTDEPVDDLASAHGIFFATIAALLLWLTMLLAVRAL
jgi:hypothetical protein